MRYSCRNWDFCYILKVTQLVRETGFETRFVSHGWMVLLITRICCLKADWSWNVSISSGIVGILSCSFHTNFIFLNGNDYSVVILLPQVLLAYARYFIWFAINASLSNLGILDLNVILGHWLTQLQNSCENVASHEEKIPLGHRIWCTTFQFLPWSPERLCINRFCITSCYIAHHLGIWLSPYWHWNFRTARKMIFFPLKSTLNKTKTQSGIWSSPLSSWKCK